MGIRNKYAALTKWLLQCGSNTIKLAFSELNEIITIPPSAYRDRPSWANCTTQSSTSFQRGWMNAGYRVTSINLQEQWVEFTKGEVTESPSRQRVVLRRNSKRAVPTTYEEELLLTVPDNLLGLTKDEYLMVQITKANSDIIEACIRIDPAYQSKGKAIMEGYFNAGDYSAKAYYDIINRIATENSTRTSKDTMECLASYCADSRNNFLDRIEAGEQQLVDVLLQHLVENGKRKDKSLASKLCRYLNEWLFGGYAYTINDSVVRAILPYYLAYYKIDRSLWQGKNFDDLSYLEFYRIFSALRDEIKVLNNHQLDHLIWYAYKNDTIRFEVAKALAQIL